MKVNKYLRNLLTLSLMRRLRIQKASFYLLYTLEIIIFLFLMLLMVKNLLIRKNLNLLKLWVMTLILSALSPSDIIFFSLFSRFPYFSISLVKLSKTNKHLHRNHTYSSAGCKIHGLEIISHIKEHKFTVR